METRMFGKQIQETTDFNAILIGGQITQLIMVWNEIMRSAIVHNL